MLFLVVLPFFAHKNLMAFGYSAFFFILGQWFFQKYLKGILAKKDHFIFFVATLHMKFFAAFFSSSFFYNCNMLIDLFAADFFRKFQINYCFLSLCWNFRLFTRITIFLFTLPFSLVFFFKSADWLEREVFDLFGIRFIHHGDLKRLLTDYGFLGHPLRKIFPLVGFLEYRFHDLLKTILGEPVVLWQVFRNFSFKHFWFHWAAAK